VDEHSLYHLKKNFFVEELEKKLVQKSDLVFASSKNLYNKVRKINEHSHYVPNGVSESFLTYKYEPTEEIESFFKNLKRPIIGYTGALNNWINYDLFYKLVSERNDWTFVVIGPVIPGNEKKFQRIAGQENVYYLGPKNHFELPLFFSNFDICMIIYELHELVEYILPVKVFEYFAFGIPVVSTPLPELKGFTDCIEFGTDSGEFIEKIEYLLKNRLGELKKRLKSAASENTWEKRLKTIKTIITKESSTVK